MPREQRKKAAKQKAPEKQRELVILTGLSGSGKLSALKTFEDLGYYSVDNLPLELVPRFADLVRQSVEIQRAALVVDVREGMRLEEFPAILEKVRRVLPTRVVYLEASEEALIRRFSETRRPHPMGRADTVVILISRFPQIALDSRTACHLRRILCLMCGFCRIHILCRSFAS